MGRKIKTATAADTFHSPSISYHIEPLMPPNKPPPPLQLSLVVLNSHVESQPAVTSRRITYFPFQLQNKRYKYEIQMCDAPGTASKTKGPFTRRQIFFAYGFV